jgi:hypothetical protein
MQKYIYRHRKVLELMQPHLGEVNLDYSIGDGRVTRFMARNLASEKRFDGYKGPETINGFSTKMFDNAIRISRKTPNFTVLYALPEQNFYDTVTLISVLHDHIRAIKDSRSYLKKEGKLVVLDHDKSHLSRSEFMGNLTDADRKEIKQRSLPAVFNDHTKMSLADCVRLGEEQGFSTVESYDHTSPEFQGHPFYLWVGQLTTY